MNDVAGRGEPFAVMGQGRLQLLEHVKCSTLNTGSTCYMFKKLDLSFKLRHNRLKVKSHRSTVADLKVILSLKFF